MSTGLHSSGLERQAEPIRAKPPVVGAPADCSALSSPVCVSGGYPDCHEPLHLASFAQMDGYS